MAKNEVVEAKSHAVAIPADYLKQLGAEAKDAAAAEAPTASKISTRNGQLKYRGEVVAGNNMDVIIPFASYRRVYYAGAFDPDKITNPKCFALSETGEDMAPTDVAPENRQSEKCETCWANAWGSDKKADGTPKKGKACKESRRLILMPAQVLESVADVQKAELAMIDLPVTSAKNYATFVNAVAATANVPPWAVKANIKCQPSKNQFEVVLTPLEVIPSVELLEAVRGRIPDAKRLALEPYDETSAGNSAVSQEQLEREGKTGKKF